jgi:hypothetical protein
MLIIGGTIRLSNVAFGNGARNHVTTTTAAAAAAAAGTAPPQRQQQPTPPPQQHQGHTATSREVVRYTSCRLTGPVRNKKIIGSNNFFADCCNCVIVGDNNTIRGNDNVVCGFRNTTVGRNNQKVRPKQLGVNIVPPGAEGSTGGTSTSSIAAAAMAPIMAARPQAHAPQGRIAKPVAMRTAQPAPPPRVAVAASASASTAPTAAATWSPSSSSSSSSSDSESDSDSDDVSSEDEVEFVGAAVRRRPAPPSSSSQQVHTVGEVFFDFAASERDRETTEEHEQCTICMSNAKCCLVMPCRHTGLCIQCAKRVASDAFAATPRQPPRCPMCREAMQTVMRIF